jgi:hypothetical protein
LGYVSALALIGSYTMRRLEREASPGDRARFRVLGDRADGFYRVSLVVGIKQRLLKRSENRVSLRRVGEGRNLFEFGERRWRS